MRVAAGNKISKLMLVGALLARAAIKASCAIPKLPLCDNTKDNLADALFAASLLQWGIFGY